MSILVDMKDIKYDFIKIKKSDSFRTASINSYTFTNIAQIDQLIHLNLW